MSRKIAPVLSTLSKADWNTLFLESTGEDWVRETDALWAKATTELRALLAVARAAKREVRHADWCLLWSGEPCDCRPKVNAALARLEKVSREGTK